MYPAGREAERGGTLMGTQFAVAGGGGAVNAVGDRATAEPRTGQS